MSHKHKLSLVLIIAIVAVIAWLVPQRLQDGDGRGKRDGDGGRVVPVEVADIERGAIELRRVFTGSLDARAEFVVAPKIGGRIEEVGADLADTVSHGQLVARLDNAEYVQAVTQAEADLAIAKNEDRDPVGPPDQVGQVPRCRIAHGINPSVGQAESQASCEGLRVVDLAP